MTDAVEDPVDPAWEAMLDKPATRGELLRIGQLVQLGLLSHTLFGVSLIGGSEEQQREIGERTVDRATALGDAMRKMVDTWKTEL